MARGIFSDRQTERQAKEGEGIIFAGRVINLRAIARAQGISVSNLSRVFRGQKGMTTEYAMKIASYLGMGLEEFLDAIAERIKTIRENEEAIIKQHLDRAGREDKQDVARILKGQPPVPRLPGLRA